VTTVAVSGGFDPLHPGHLSFLERAAQCACRLAVLVDSDEFIAAKRGRPPLMPQADRAKVLRGLRVVDDVVLLPPDGAWPAQEEFQVDLYAVGPDHADMDFPEYEECQARGVEVVALDHPLAHVHSRDLLAEWSRPRWVNPPVTVDGLVSRWGAELLVCRRGLAAGGEGLLDLPGGFLEPGETLEECLRRECREELGVGVWGLVYRGSQVAYARDGRQVINAVFDCRLDAEPGTSGEVAECLWCDAMPEGEWYSECCRNAAEGWFRERGR
jgi:cytidyltransferase-like protein